MGRLLLAEAGTGGALAEAEAVPPTATVPFSPAGAASPIISQPPASPLPLPPPKTSPSPPQMLPMSTWSLSGTAQQGVRVRGVLGCRVWDPACQGLGFRGPHARV